jgi:hypothetical protein
MIIATITVRAVIDGIVTETVTALEPGHGFDLHSSLAGIYTPGDTQFLVADGEEATWVGIDGPVLHGKLCGQLSGIGYLNDPEVDPDSLFQTLQPGTSSLLIVPTNDQFIPSGNLWCATLKVHEQEATKPRYIYEHE